MWGDLRQGLRAWCALKIMAYARVFKANTLAQAMHLECHHSVEAWFGSPGARRGSEPVVLAFEVNAGDASRPSAQATHHNVDSLVYLTGLRARKLIPSVPTAASLDA